MRKSVQGRERGMEGERRRRRNFYVIRNKLHAHKNDSLKLSVNHNSPTDLLTSNKRTHEGKLFIKKDYLDLY